MKTDIVCVCVCVDVVSGRDPAVMVPRASACRGLWDTAQQQGDKRHFNDLLRWRVTSCSPTFLPPRGDTGSGKMLKPETTVVTIWWMFSIVVKVHRNSVTEFFFESILTFFLFSFCSFFMFSRHNFSVVNFLRGKTNSSNLTERSPLLRFSQDDRWGVQVLVSNTQWIH